MIFIYIWISLLIIYIFPTQISENYNVAMHLQHSAIRSKQCNQHDWRHLRRTLNVAVPFLSFDLAKMTCDKFFMNSIVGPFQVYPFVHCMAGLFQVYHLNQIKQHWHCVGGWWLDRLLWERKSQPCGGQVRQRRKSKMCQKAELLRSSFELFLK